MGSSRIYSYITRFFVFSTGPSCECRALWHISLILMDVIPLCRDISVLLNVVKGKGKAVPLQAWSGPEGSRKLRFPDFMTTAQDGGKVSLMHRPPLPPRNTLGTHFC